MSDISTETPNPVEKAIAANTEAEAALGKEIPDVEAAKAWAAISANWLSLTDPRSQAVRRLNRVQRPQR